MADNYLSKICFITFTGMRNLHPDMWPIKWRLLAKVSAYLLYN